MVWVKLDDQFPEHPKVAQAGPLAMAMQVAALCYCNRKMTDGFVPRSIARTLLDWEIVTSEGIVYSVSVTSGMSGTEVEPSWVIALLVDARMWVEVPGGYRIHDYHHYQPSRADIQAEKKQKSDAGKAGAAARWGDTSHGTSHNGSDDTSHGTPDSTRHGARDGRTMAERCPDPVPVPKEHSQPSAALALVATATGPPFEQAFWEQYPKRNGKRIGKAATERAWNRLSVADREAACAALPNYAAGCNGFPKDPERYLRHRVWVDWAAPPPATVYGSGEVTYR